MAMIKFGAVFLLIAGLDSRRITETGCIPKVQYGPYYENEVLKIIHRAPVKRNGPVWNFDKFLALGKFALWAIFFDKMSKKNVLIEK